MNEEYVTTSTLDGRGLIGLEMARGVCDGGGGDTVVGSGIKRLKHALKRPKEMGKHGYDCLRLHVYMQMEEYISQKQAGRVSPKRPNIRERKEG